MSVFALLFHSPLLALRLRCYPHVLPVMASMRPYGEHIEVELPAPAAGWSVLGYLCVPEAVEFVKTKFSSLKIVSLQGLWHNILIYL